jgi:hypothetical protein
MGRQLDIVFDVDLGELAPRHHVIARGIDLGYEVPVERWQRELEDQRQHELDAGGAPFEPASGFRRRILGDQDKEIVGTRITEPELHYEFVPGLEEEENEGQPFFWYWMLQVSDDVGTYYQDSNNGAIARSDGGPATHGTRDLGAPVPKSATRLSISFRPAVPWVPGEPYVRELEIDLRLRTVASVRK